MKLLQTPRSNDGHVINLLFPFRDLMVCIYFRYPYKVYLHLWSTNNASRKLGQKTGFFKNLILTEIEQKCLTKIVPLLFSWIRLTLHSHQPGKCVHNWRMRVVLTSIGRLYRYILWFPHQRTFCWHACNNNLPVLGFVSIFFCETEMTQFWLARRLLCQHLHASWALFPSFISRSFYTDEKKATAILWILELSKHWSTDDSEIVELSIIVTSDQNTQVLFRLWVRTWEHMHDRGNWLPNALFKIKYRKYAA